MLESRVLLVLLAVFSSPARINAQATNGTRIEQKPVEASARTASELTVIRGRIRSIRTMTASYQRWVPRRVEPSKDELRTHAHLFREIDGIKCQLEEAGRWKFKARDPVPAERYETTHYFRATKGGPIVEHKEVLACDGTNSYRRSQGKVVLSKIDGSWEAKRNLLYFLGARNMIIGPGRKIWDVLDPDTKKDEGRSVTFRGSFKEDWIDATQKVKVTLSKSAGLSPSEFLFFGPGPNGKSRRTRMSDFKKFKGGLWVPMTVRRKTSGKTRLWRLFSDVRVNPTLPNTEFTLTVSDKVKLEDLRARPTTPDKIVVPYPSKKGK